MEYIPSPLGALGSEGRRGVLEYVAINYVKSVATLQKLFVPLLPKRFKLHYYDTSSIQEPHPRRSHRCIPRVHSQKAGVDKAIGRRV